ncbi:GNAT family N-acetyltransferase [Glycomyces harbinensis]|uniref:Acetyltransferase (GNAT) family protein n=1 Tax=Glycomyces harbinensis TaxID=58114 RepID=A0A1G6QVZ8_9ACTN|nr:GNAT family N-acetyltransferase [Glycomyces harbinensis]SDC96134.1 Acetyltransferase (GNAT) family protein [Glycomyces harbinensis]
MAPDTPYAPVWRIGPASRDAVVDVLADAFRADPLAAWLFPDRISRTHYQAGFYGSLLDHPAAETHLAGDAAAIWLDLAPGRHLGDPAQEAAPEDPALARLHALGAALAPRHPAGPHLYLAVMGVAASRQGSGLGTSLMRHRLDQADRDGVGTYLEASSPRSRAFYLRHGFADLGEPVRLADAPPLFPMWRHPAADTRPVHRR